LPVDEELDEMDALTAEVIFLRTVVTSLLINQIGTSPADRDTVMSLTRDFVTAAVEDIRETNPAIWRRITERLDQTMRDVAETLALSSRPDR
jgi:hypothetical protein